MIEKYTSAACWLWRNYQYRSCSASWLEQELFERVSAEGREIALDPAGALCEPLDGILPRGPFIDCEDIGNGQFHLPTFSPLRAFLGPTGLLAANLQDANGDPLPGVLGMVQLSSPVDPVQVAGSSTNEGRLSNL